MSEYSKITYNGYNYLEYNRPGNIPSPEVYKSAGNTCSKNSDCNFGLWCYSVGKPNSGVCSEWRPDGVILPEKKTHIDWSLEPDDYYMCTRDTDCSGNNKCVQNLCTPVVEGIKEGFDYIARGFDNNDYATIQLRDKEERQVRLKSTSSSSGTKAHYMSKYKRRREGDVIESSEIGI